MKSAILSCVRSKGMAFILLLLLTLGCDIISKDTDSSIELIWGIGNEIPAARQSLLLNEAPVKMISSWYNKPDDLEWMRNYNNRNTLSELYGKGYAQELIVWLDEYPEYATSPQFQTDLEELIHIFKGNGPNYGPLYVVLFTEFETYSDDPTYYSKLKDAYLQSIETIKQVDEDANVALGFGGYGWSGLEHRDLKDWELEAIEASDFVAVQAHHHVSNIDRMIPQVRNSIEQLGSYGKPVMMSHFRIWKREGEGGRSTSKAFEEFMDEMFTEDSLGQLVDDGLFAWNYFNDDFINERGEAFDRARHLVKVLSSKKTELSYFQK